MGVIGTLAVNIVARTQKFQADIAKSRKSISRFSGDAKRATSAVKGFIGAFAAGAGVYGISRSLTEAASRMDKLAKTSDKLGIASERLAGIQHAANQTGVATNTLNMALQRMTRRVAEAATGTGEAVKALKELGLDARELNSLSPDRMFSRIANAMANVEGEGNRVRLAFKLFDSEGVDLVNTLALGSDGLERMQKEAEKLGIAIGRNKLADIEAMNDAMDRLGKAWQGASNKILIDISPLAVSTINTIADVNDLMHGRTPARAAGRREGGTLGRPGTFYGMNAKGTFLEALARGDRSVGPAKPGFADHLMAESVKAEKRRTAMRDRNAPLLNAIEAARAASSELPDRIRGGFARAGRGMSTAMGGIPDAVGAFGNMARDPIRSAIASARRASAHNASITELESRLDAMGAGNQSRKQLPLNAAIRKGSAEAEVAIARQKQQADEVKRDKEKVESLKAIRDEMEDMNQQFKAGTIPVFSMEAIA